MFVMWEKELKQCQLLELMQQSVEPYGRSTWWGWDSWNIRSRSRMSNWCLLLQFQFKISDRVIFSERVWENRFDPSWVLFFAHPDIFQRCTKWQFIGGVIKGSSCLSKYPHPHTRTHTHTTMCPHSLLHPYTLTRTTTHTCNIVCPHTNYRTLTKQLNQPHNW